MTDISRLDFLGADSELVRNMMRALATAESLTDALAIKILAQCDIEVNIAEKFLMLLRCTNIIIRRNSGWSIDEDIRRMLLLEAREKDIDLSDIQRLLINISTSHEGLDAHEIPHYLLTKAGQAYHTAEIGIIEKSLLLYAESAESHDLGEIWLAGKLASEQQANGVLPQNAIEPIYLRALALYREGDIEAAYSQFLKVVSSENRSEPVARSLQLIGLIEANRDEFDKALQHLADSVDLYAEIRCKNGLAWSLRCRALVRQRIDDFIGALDDLNRAVPLCFGDKKAKFLGLRAHIKRAMYNPKGAMLDLNLAIELAKPETLPALLHQRGLLKRELNEFESALTDLDHAIEICNNTLLVQILNTRASLKRELGHWGDALHDIDVALKLIDGDNSKFANNARSFLLNTQSVLRRDQGDFEGALEDINRIIEIQDEYSNIDLKILRARAKKIRKFMSKLTNAIADSAKRKVWYEIFISLARTYGSIKEWRLAALLYLRAKDYASSDFDLAKCLGGAGGAYEILGMYDTALPYLDNAENIAPDDSRILAILARVEDQLGYSIDHTGPIFTRAIEADPKNIWATSWYALALSRAGLHSEAIAKARYSSTSSSNPIILFNLAQVLDASPDQEDKKDAIQIAIRARGFANPVFSGPADFLRERGIN